MSISAGHVLILMLSSDHLIWRCGVDTSGKAFVEFWKWVGDKGLMKHNSARNLRTASIQVLGVLDDWETLDVTALNADDLHRRFVNKRHTEFTPASLAAYKRRF